MSSEVELSVSQFVDLFNQTMDIAYRSVVITGELANLRVSKNRWVYFDLKDNLSVVKCFGTVYQLPGPLEDGIMLKVRAQPRLHHTYGFSLNVLSLQPTGEGSIKKAANLLQAKLAQEGLFAADRKRLLPYPPERIGLITSAQAAAYSDFIKILGSRWRGLKIQFIDVQVQGEVAGQQIESALEHFNAMAQPPEVVVLIRGGGSPEDLLAWSLESVTRAVAASRVPTLVAIGHEIDVSLAELAADQRASTPSHAAELLVPDRKHSLKELSALARHLNQTAEHHLDLMKLELNSYTLELESQLALVINQAAAELKHRVSLLAAFDPAAILRRGYAIVRAQTGQLLREAKTVSPGDRVNVQLGRGGFRAEVISRRNYGDET